MRISLTILALVALLAGGVPRIVRAGDSAAAPAAGPGGGGPNDWPATVPSFATNTEDWSKLTRELLEHNMPYGALAAAYRMLMFFSDLNLKEQAYRTIVQIIDMGYAFPTKSFFVTGDIEPKEDYDFSNSYYFYKAMAALDKGVRKWADSYLATVDTANFPKYLFYQAIDAYQRQEYDKSEKLLLKILAAKPGDKYASLVRKVARTLARIYFERQQYAQAYDVYRTFLLRMNPIEPGDWLEAAWNLYYLQRYEEALGMVFNLESLPTGEMVNLEKYVLRALIYEEVCATEYMEKLVTTFEKEFGAAILGIKTGRVLSQIPELNRIYVPENQAFYRITATMANLDLEQGRVGELSGSLHELARYLYTTELSVNEKRLPAYAEEASQRAANHLIGFSESLRFIKFDVAKSRLGPDMEAEAAKDKDKEHGPGKTPVEGVFDIHWIQDGDFWRDERLHYRAVLKNQCVQ